MTESPDGTTITKTTDPAITSLMSERWTLVAAHGGQVAVNGVTDAGTQNVVKMLYAGHIVYHTNKQGDTYCKAQAGATWTYTTAPVLITPPVVVVLPNPTRATVRAQIDEIVSELASIRSNITIMTP